MRPLHFGSSARPLYGVMHEPPGAARDVGVVVCPPGVHEYNPSHWALRQLAAQLASKGFPALRFDWTGTGDSGGELEDGSFGAWEEDVLAAQDELVDLSGARSVILVGLRLGAAIAARAASRCAQASRVVLWDPVVRGATYLRELEAHDASANLHLLHWKRPPGELLGYPLPAAQRAEIEALDVRDVKLAIASDVFVETKSAEVEALSRGLGAALHVVQEASAGPRAREAARLPARTVVAIAAHLAEAGGRA